MSQYRMFFNNNNNQLIVVDDDLGYVDDYDDDDDDDLLSYILVKHLMFHLNVPVLTYRKKYSQYFYSF